MGADTRGTVTQTMIRRELMYTRTMTVGRVSKVFSNGWVQVDPQIQQVRRDLKGAETPEDLPVLERVPIAAFKAGGFVLTLPVKVGDEGIIIFSDRSLSVWKETGAKNPPRESHFHHLEDGVFFPIPTSKKGAVAGYDSSSLYAGAEDKSAYLQISAGGIAKLFAAASFTIDSPLTHLTGNLQVDKNLLVSLLSQLMGVVTTGATVSSAGIHTAPDFVRT